MPPPLRLFQVLKVDTDVHKDAVAQFNIYGLPLLIAFQDGVELNRWEGALTKVRCGAHGVLVLLVCSAVGGLFLLGRLPPPPTSRELARCGDARSNERPWHRAPPVIFGVGPLDERRRRVPPTFPT